jgi:hypothetical protein
MVPIFVFFMGYVTPGRGSPAESVTFPVILFLLMDKMTDIRTFQCNLPVRNRIDNPGVLKLLVKDLTTND